MPKAVLRIVVLLLALFGNDLLAQPSRTSKDSPAGNAPPAMPGGKAAIQEPKVQP
jgi:hypothetical protein